ncbi:MAG: LacI family DNA-binding transcriptional regulator [Marinilabiliales bacterium]
MKKYSIKDIAEILGVSKTLVSLVLNNKGDQYGINKETQKKVFETAKRLKYRPNKLAQGLRLGKTKSIGLVVPDISNPFYSKIAKHIENIVSKDGYSLIICDTDEDEKKESKIIDTLIERNVDGLIIASTLLNALEIQKIKEQSLPFVFIDRYLDEIECNYVGVDNYQGTYDAIEHLIKENFKKIAYFSITPEHISTLAERKRGYLDAIKKYNLSIDNELIKTLPYNNLATSVKKELKKLFDLESKPDSLFLANYKLALEVLKAIKYNRINLPDKFKIFVFDDNPLFDIVNYPVSSIAQPVEEICDNAFKILKKEINHKGEEELQTVHLELPTTIILR